MWILIKTQKCHLKKNDRQRQGMACPLSEELDIAGSRPTKRQREAEALERLKAEFERHMIRTALRLQKTQ